jgi:hypothetical protein
MAYIDDACSRVAARFYESEGTVPALDSLKCDVTQSGIPLAVYCEKPTTIARRASRRLRNSGWAWSPGVSLSGAVGALGIERIHADSPQAKGKVERLFQTWQDWLIKELRLAGIATLLKANRFLDVYLPTYNQRFAVQPAQATDLYRPSPSADTASST